jgi:hypothetical protein
MPPLFLYKLAQIVSTQYLSPAGNHQCHAFARVVVLAA